MKGMNWGAGKKRDWRQVARYNTGCPVKFEFQIDSE